MCSVSFLTIYYSWLECHSLKGNPYLCIGAGSCLPRQNLTKSSEYLERERPEPMEQYVKRESCILHEDQGRPGERERRDDPGRLSLLTGH